jgi:acylglycerol lipase
VVAAYRGDTLVHQGKPTLGLMSALFDGFALVERAGELTVPVLLQHGERDVLTDPAGTRALDAALRGTADKTVRWYDGLWHEIYNEPERDRPLADLRAWLDAHR